MHYIGLDISTETGFVKLDSDGNVIEEAVIAEKGEDPERMIRLVDRIMAMIDDGDKVAVESFGFSSRQGFMLGGIGWAVRMGLYRRAIPYLEVAPSQLKRFTGANGNANKISVAIHVYKRWGYESKENNDNITDAFVLAQIAREFWGERELPQFQERVLSKIRLIDRKVENKKYRKKERKK